MTVRIVTDSTCDLPAELTAERGIEVVPLYVNVDGQGFLDGIDISRETFYSDLPGYATPPTTASPGPGAFERVYRRLAKAGASAIISVHISETLSEVVNVARIAARGIKSVPITVIDCGQLTLGVGLTVAKAAAVAATGAELQEVVDVVKSRVERTWTFAALATVEFLKRSGRLNQFQYGLASLLRIVPLLKMHDGLAEMERVRANQKAMQRVVALAEQLGPLEELAIVHTHARGKG